MTADDKTLQLELYGQVLAGDETVIKKAALSRLHYLKEKLRRKLSWGNIGDNYDIATDINKSLLLGLGILSGQITNAALIARYKAYISAQIVLYGGPAAIMNKLEANALPISEWMAKFNTAKTAIGIAENIDEVNLVDIE